MLPPDAGDPEGDEDAAGSQIERSIGRFGETLNSFEGHKRRLIDAFGWWTIRTLIAAGAVVLVVLSRPCEAAICAGVFVLTLLFR